jgi:hypothetical protein
MKKLNLDSMIAGRTQRWLAIALLVGSTATTVAAQQGTSPAPTAADAPAGTAATPAPSADGASGGAWQPHKYQFNFMGFTTIYSCDGLGDKLRLLLRLSGAAPDIKVDAPCVRGTGRPDKLAFAYLTFSSLKPDPTAVGVPGSWKHVELSPHHPFDLETGDCELIEQFRDSVLPMFTIRNLKSSVTCVPHQDIGSYSLSYDVFVPVKPPKKAASP